MDNGYPKYSEEIVSNKVKSIRPGNVHHNCVDKMDIINSQTKDFEKRQFPCYNRCGAKLEPRTLTQAMAERGKWRPDFIEGVLCAFLLNQ